VTARDPLKRVQRLRNGERSPLTRKDVGVVLQDIEVCFIQRTKKGRYACESRIKHGNRQTIDTLIREEALLLAKYLRHERKEWIPRFCQKALPEIPNPQRS